jgi:alkylation response protein AidB-like acyl-CoA dehydrogenase
MISFALTEDQTLARAATAQFAAEEARPAARAAEEAGSFPEPLLRRAWDLGLTQTAAAAEPVEQATVLNALVLEEIAYGDAALAVAMAGALGFARALATQGTDNQRERHLCPFQSETPAFAAIAAVDAGWFRGAGRATRAERVGAGWRIVGAKALIPLAARCGRLLVTAETEEGARGFIVETDRPGVRVEPAKGTLGMRALQMADIAFDGVEATDDDLILGGTRRIIDASRVALTAILSGLARAVYDYTLPYTKERVVHGEAIARKQAVAFRLADMHIATNAIRWTGLRAAAELDARPDAPRAARLAQRYAAEQTLKVADEGVQLFGGYGFVRDYPLEMWYRNARSLSVLDGVVGV